jgi:hypothetical protein
MTHRRVARVVFGLGLSLLAFASCVVQGEEDELLGEASLAINGPIQALPLTATCKPYGASALRVVNDVPDALGWRKCDVEITCGPKGAAAPPAADEACRAAMNDACKAPGFSFKKQYRRFREGACADFPLTDFDGDCDFAARQSPPYPTVEATCDVPVPKGPIEGLCPEGSTTITRGPGCGATSAAGTGHTLLAENGSPDGQSATFQCQWVENCNVTPIDPESYVYDERNDTITHCNAADGAGPLCDQNARSWLISNAGQARYLFFQRGWNSGMREYIDPLGLLWRHITRDEVRAQAQADCNGKSLTQADRTAICRERLAAVLPAQPQRLSYCCTSDNPADGGGAAPQPPAGPPGAGGAGAGGAGTGNRGGGPLEDDWETPIGG